jgi:excisionase family DNA binding protein
MGFEFDTEEEEIARYQEVMMTTKEDILQSVKWERHRWNEKSSEDHRHTAAYYSVLNDLADRFIRKLEKTNLFDAPYGMWAYIFEIRSDGMFLTLEHADSVDFDEDQNPGDSTVDEVFTMLSVKTRLLSVEEYAKLYGVETVTVRQWIRRGKIRTAKKYGKEWRIPELTEVPERGYRMGQYSWSNQLTDVPEEYGFLREPGIATLYQDDKDKTKYHVSVGDRYSNVIDAKERERLELFLISHPLVKYISNVVGCYAG